MAKANGQLTNSHREARECAARLRHALQLAEKQRNCAARVIRDVLTPDDLATLNTFAELVIERAYNA